MLEEEDDAAAGRGVRHHSPRRRLQGVVPRGGGAGGRFGIRCHRSGGRASAAGRGGGATAQRRRVRSSLRLGARTRTPRRLSRRRLRGAPRFASSQMSLASAHGTATKSPGRWNTRSPAPAIRPSEVSAPEGSGGSTCARNCRSAIPAAHMPGPWVLALSGEARRNLLRRVQDDPSVHRTLRDVLDAAPGDDEERQGRSASTTDPRSSANSRSSRRNAGGCRQGRTRSRNSVTFVSSSA